MKLKCPHCGRTLVHGGQIRRERLPCPACGGEVNLNEARETKTALPATFASNTAATGSVNPLPPDLASVRVAHLAAATNSKQSAPIGTGSMKSQSDSSAKGPTTGGDSSSKRKSKMRLEACLIFASRLFWHPAVALGLCAVILFSLYISDLLLPALRFVLLGSVTLAVIGFLFSFARVAMLAFTANAQPDNDKKLKNAGVACCVIAVLGSIMLFVLPLIAQSNTAASTKRNDVLKEDSGTTASKPASEAELPKAANVTLNLAPPIDAPIESSDAKARRTSEDAAAQFLGALFQGAAESAAREQAAEKERQYQQFRQGLNNLSKCPRCGGAGTYRYVDVYGNLQSRNCPSCLGSGGSYGSSPMFGSP